MSLTVRIHPAAAEELDAAIAWYDQGGQGRGPRFEAAFDDVVDRLLTWPESGATDTPCAEGPAVRTAKVLRSAFRVVYVVVDGTLWVLAVAHERRRPGYWHERVEAVALVPARVDFGIVDSASLTDTDRERLRELWDQAYGDRFSPEDAEHAFGGTHVVAWLGHDPVAHASVVPRRLRFDDRWVDAGYVEAVAVRPDMQGQGLGEAVMELLRDEIAERWPAAMLSTGRATRFYEKLGWERWQGLSYTLTSSGGVIPDHEHGGLMILRIDPGVVPDLSVDVTCEERSGDAW